MIQRNFTRRIFDSFVCMEYNRIAIEDSDKKTRASYTVQNVNIFRIRKKREKIEYIGKKSAFDNNVRCLKYSKSH